jgi:hypothetical protein
MLCAGAGTDLIWTVLEAAAGVPKAAEGAAAHTSGKNSLYFHTLGYEMGNFQKSFFFHTKKVLFHTLKNNFTP